MKKRIVFFCTAIFLMVEYAFAYTFSATAPSGQTLYYNIIDQSNHYVEVTYGTTMMPTPSDVYVEDSTRPVGNVVIPSNVFYAGNNYCVRTIGKRAFFGCRHLKTITIPQSIDTINDDAFHYCDSLYKVCYFAKKAIVKSNSYSTTVTWSPFRHDYTTGNTSINILQLGDSVQTIADYLFSSCHNLGGNIIFPNSVKKIGHHAFANTNITAITLSSNINTIGGAAFYNCASLGTVNYNVTNCIIEAEVAYELFENCISLNVIHIGNNVKAIPDGLFRGVSSLTGTVLLPSGLKRIGTGAFSHCSGLSGQLIIPDSVTFIGMSAFSNCIGISSITLGRDVDSIGTSALGYMSSVHTIHYNAQNMHYADYATTGTTNITSLLIGENVQKIPNYFIDHCPYLTAVTFPNSLTNIGISNFSYCGLSGDMVLPNSLQEIGAGAFVACTNLTSITCPATIPPNVIQSFGLTYIFTQCWNTPLYVPCSSINAYQSASGWSNFTNISGIGGCDYTVTLSVNNSSMGSVSGGGTYTQGATATISATANSGYHFDHWSDGNTQNPRSLTVTSDISLTAYFEANPVTQYTITVNSNNATMGSASGGGTFNEGSTTTITATANNGYHFTQWQDGNTNNPRTITVTNNATYTAYFAPTQYTITVNSNNATMGSASGSGTFNEGTTTTITATANNGYHFTQWQDGNTNNPRTITVTNNATYTAYFAPTQYTITVNSANTSMGTVSGGGTYNAGTTINISAIANSGYRFDHWQDGNTNNPRTITVTNNATYTAFFMATQGIEEVGGQRSEVNVYAVEGKIVVEGAEGETVRVYDVTGRMVQTFTHSSHQALPAGVYMVKVGQHPARKVVVLR